MINIYVILVSASNLLVGVTGLLSMAQAAFYGIGAYFSVFALSYLGLPLIPTLLLAFSATGLLGWLFGYITLRLSGDYFVLASMGFQIITFTILYNWIPVTKGPYGISGIPSPKLFGMVEIYGIIPFLILSTILAIGVCLVLRRLIHSPFGRILKCLRDDEIPLKTLKRDPNFYKTWSFALSSALISIAGFLYASYISYIDPTSFTLDESIFILTAVIIGGQGTIKGSILGAVFVILLPELLRFVGMPDSIAANMRMIIYGLGIVLLMMYRPRGIAGERLSNN